MLEQIALTGQGVLEEMIRVFDFNLACLPGIVRPRACAWEWAVTGGIGVLLAPCRRQTRSDEELHDRSV